MKWITQPTTFALNQTIILLNGELVKPIKCKGYCLWRKLQIVWLKSYNLNLTVLTCSTIHLNYGLCIMHRASAPYFVLATTNHHHFTKTFTSSELLKWLKDFILSLWN